MCRVQHARLVAPRCCTDCKVAVAVGCACDGTRWNIFRAVEQHARVDGGGYSGLADVTKLDTAKNDHMESFFLSETLKYLVSAVGLQFTGSGARPSHVGLYVIMRGMSVLAVL